MNPDTELLNTRLTVSDAKITKAEKEIKALKGRDMSYLKKPEICAEIDKLRAEKKELTDHNRELTQQIANLGVSAFQAAQAHARKCSGSDSRSSSSAQSYKEAKKSVVYASRLFAITPLTPLQLKDWEDTLDNNRGKKEVKDIQPAAMELFSRLANAAGNNVGITNGIRTRDKISDFAVFPATRNVRSVNNIKCVGEMKRPPLKEKQHDDSPLVLTNFPNEDRGSRLDGWRTHWLWSDIHRVQGHQGG